MTKRHGARCVVRPTKRVNEQPSRAVVNSSRHLRRFSEGNARERKRMWSLEESSLGVPSQSVGSLEMRRARRREEWTIGRAESAWRGNQAGRRAGKRAGRLCG